MKASKKFLAVFAALMLISAAFTYAQVKQGKAKNVKEFIAGCDSVWYYGIDVSHVRVTDGKKIPKCSSYAPVYPQAWISYIEQELPPLTVVKPGLKVKGFTYVPADVQKPTARVVPDFIIGTEYSFPLDTIARAVKGYELSQKTGTGLVIIAENFNKPREASIIWIVFFDLRTRELLWTVKESGPCAHMGYTAHWGSGVVKGFNYFLQSLN
ncbi:MAG: hypothetical protein WCI48_13690 [Bacteroidota bacterium]|jgi:hypothetical protein